MLRYFCLHFILSIIIITHSHQYLFTRIILKIFFTYRFEQKKKLQRELGSKFIEMNVRKRNDRVRSFSLVESVMLYNMPILAGKHVSWFFFFFSEREKKRSAIKMCVTFCTRELKNQEGWCDQEREKRWMNETRRDWNRYLVEASEVKFYIHSCVVIDVTDKSPLSILHEHEKYRFSSFKCQPWYFFLWLRDIIWDNL